jgi:hypothetical protein
VDDARRADDHRSRSGQSIASEALRDGCSAVFKLNTIFSCSHDSEERWDKEGLEKHDVKEREC